MKWIVLFTSVFFCVTVVHSAEYVVESGDTIGIIAQKTGCSVEHLSELNNIKAPAYIIRKGQMLEYVSEQDFEDALKWVDKHLKTIYPSHPDYNQFMRLRGAIISRSVNYGGYLTPHADEVILFAKLYSKEK